MRPVMLLVVLGVGACGEPREPRMAPMAEDAPPVATTAAPLGPLPNGVTPLRYALELTVDPSAERFSGAVAIDVELASAHERIWLHALGLDVAAAYAIDAGGARHDTRLVPELDSGVASLRFARALEPGRATLHLVFSAPFNQAVNALFRTERDGAYYVASQLQPVAARQIFPSFDDPRFKTPWDVTITAPPEHVAVTNAPEISVTQLDNGWLRHEFATSQPLPTYLLAFAVGPYDSAAAEPIGPSPLRNRAVPLRGIAARGMGERFGLSLRETPALLAWLEDYFGTPYPYAKLDLIAMPAGFGGAMENAGAVTYDETLILMGEDPPLQQRRSYMNVHAHELAHMWFGDFVTPEWWTDVWLNESFATWMANKAAQALWPAGEFDRATLADALGAMAADSLASARRIREPVLRDEEIEDAFDGITYEKGGGVLAMFESYVGAEAFRSGVRLHMERYGHGVANAAQFMASLAEGSGANDIAASFRSFIEQPGVPVVTAGLECDGVAPMLELRQQRYAPIGSTIAAGDALWQIPVCVAYDVAGTPGRVCEMLTTRTATLALDIDTCPSVIHPNAGGTGYYRFTLDEPGWAALVVRAPQLDPAEALTLIDSLDAAFRAGTVSAQRYVEGLVALAPHPAWDVAAATVAKLESMLDVLPPEARPRVAPALREIYRPRYAALAGADGESARLLERALLGFLALELRDPAIRAELAARAARYVGLESAPDPRAIAAELLGTTLAVGVQDLDAAFFARLTDAALASEDPYIRQTALYALGQVEQQAQGAQLRSAVLEQRFPLLDSMRIVFVQMELDATRDTTWTWLRENGATIIARVPEAFRTQIVPRFGSAFCSAARAAELEAFIVGHASALPGYERSLAQVMEQIALCAALREAKGTELEAALVSIG